MFPTLFNVFEKALDQKSLIFKLSKIISEQFCTSFQLFGENSTQLPCGSSSKKSERIICGKSKVLCRLHVNMAKYVAH